MRRRRSLRLIAILAALALAGFAGRAIWANGVFSPVPTGFLGSCKILTGMPGVADIAGANGVTFVSVSSARGPHPEDGIYVLSPAGKMTRLSGTPKNFHPRGIGIFRSPDGSGIFLMAVNRRITGRFSIDSFEVINPKTNPALVAQGTVEGGLLTDPQDVAPVGPGTFYVSNGSAKERLVRWLASWGVMPGSNILYFNGMTFRAVVEGIYGARGLAMTPDGAHLLVAGLTTRSLISLRRDIFTGNLTEAGSLTLPAAPDKISLDGAGEVWVAGHANLLHWRKFAADTHARAPSQIFRVSLSGGVPQEATQVYGDDGNGIAAASVGAASGKRLLIGSSLDDKLLDCTSN